MSVWILTWPLKVKGQKNGEMPKRGRRVTRVVWGERSAQRKEEKTERKRVKDINHIREKMAKENKIILNIWCDVVFGVKTLVLRQTQCFLFFYNYLLQKLWNFLLIQRLISQRVGPTSQHIHQAPQTNWTQDKIKQVWITQDKAKRRRLEEKEDEFG